MLTLYILHFIYYETIKALGKRNENPICRQIRHKSIKKK